MSGQIGQADQAIDDQFKMVYEQIHSMAEGGPFESNLGCFTEQAKT